MSCMVGWPDSAARQEVGRVRAAAQLGAQPFRMPDGRGKGWRGSFRVASQLVQYRGPEGHRALHHPNALSLPEQQHSTHLKLIPQRPTMLRLPMPKLPKLHGKPSQHVY